MKENKRHEETFLDIKDMWSIIKCISIKDFYCHMNDYKRKRALVIHVPIEILKIKIESENEDKIDASRTWVSFFLSFFLAHETQVITHWLAIIDLSFLFINGQPCVLIRITRREKRKKWGLTEFTYQNGIVLYLQNNEISIYRFHFEYF